MNRGENLVIGLGRLGRIIVNPGGLLDAREEHQVRVRNRPALQAIRQTGFPPDEVLHQPQRRGAERIILRDALHLDGLRHTGATNPITTLEQGDPVPGAHQVVGRDQAVDARTDDSDIL